MWSCIHRVRFLGRQWKRSGESVTHRLITTGVQETREATLYHPRLRRGELVPIGTAE